MVNEILTYMTEWLLTFCVSDCCGINFNCYFEFLCTQYYDSVHLASDQKDLLISQLKAEIFEIEQRDKDYLALRD